jgi:dihydroorotate dehydrogenase (fumarate)
MKTDLSTTYLGLKLSNPLVIAASPLSAQLHCLQRLEEHGAAAAVLPSLFEEQIEGEQVEFRSPPGGRGMAKKEFVHLPDLSDYNSGPDSYLRHIEAAKRQIRIPIIGSLNGATPGGWVRFAKLIQEAGADALELNVCFLPTNPNQTAADVEAQYLEVVSSVRAEVSIPLAIKIGPYFSAIPNMAKRLVQAGADGLVLFNRYLEPDVDLDSQEITPSLALSSRDEVRLPLRWIGILRGQLTASLAATSGIHAADDVLKLLLVGADVTMLASALIRHGPGHLATLLGDLERLMAARGYRSVQALKGSISHVKCSDPSAFERANYMKAIISLSEG